MNELVGKIEGSPEYKVNVQSDEVTVNVKINEVGPRGFPGKDGKDGGQGPEGKAATIQIGSVKTGDPNTQASVENSGTENAAIFDFVIPQGKQGQQGKQGIQGPEGKQGIQGQEGKQGPEGKQGIQGIQGEAATIKIGSVKTGEPDEEASVVNSGTENEAVLDFVIPKGKQGIQGPEGKQGIQGIQGPDGKQGPEGKQGPQGLPGYTPIEGVDYFTAEEQSAFVSQVLNQFPSQSISKATSATLDANNRTIAPIYNIWYNNLGTPSLFEVASLFMEFGCKSDFAEKSRVLYETSDDLGQTWTELAVTDEVHETLWGVLT